MEVDMEDKYRMTVFGTCQFEAIHCWPNAPKDVEFLRTPHRHLFKLQFHAPVWHEDRDVEFIMLKRSVEHVCREKWAGKDIGHTSCESIAIQLLEYFPQLHHVEVSEDGENGAAVWRK